MRGRNYLGRIHLDDGSLCVCVFLLRWPTDVRAWCNYAEDATFWFIGRAEIIHLCYVRKLYITQAELFNRQQLSDCRDIQESVLSVGDIIILISF